MTHFQVWWWATRVRFWARVGQVVLWLCGWSWASAREQVDLEIVQAFRRRAWAHITRREPVTGERKP